MGESFKKILLEINSTTVIKLKYQISFLICVKWYDSVLETYKHIKFTLIQVEYPHVNHV